MTKSFCNPEMPILIQNVIPTHWKCKKRLGTVKARFGIVEMFQVHDKFLKACPQCACYVIFPHPLQAANSSMVL